MYWPIEFILLLSAFAASGFVMRLFMSALHIPLGFDEVLERWRNDAVVSLKVGAAPAIIVTAGINLN